MAQRSQFNLARAVMMALSIGAELNRSNAGRNGNANTASPFVRRSNLPVFPKAEFKLVSMVVPSRTRPGALHPIRGSEPVDP